MRILMEVLLEDEQFDDVKKANFINLLAGKASEVAESFRDGVGRHAAVINYEINVKEVAD